MRRLWIIFSQTTTICLAVLFVVSTLKPEWLPTRTAPGEVGDPPRVPVVNQDTQGAAPTSGHRADSYHDAVRKALPSVVNIFTSKEVRVRRSPLLNDPILRRSLGDQLGSETQRATSLGSGVVVSASGYILTNNHVVEAADEIEIAFPDGKKYLAKAIGAALNSEVLAMAEEALQRGFSDWQSAKNWYFLLKDTALGFQVPGVGVTNGVATINAPSTGVFDGVNIDRKSTRLNSSH